MFSFSFCRKSCCICPLSACLECWEDPQSISHVKITCVSLMCINIWKLLMLYRKYCLGSSFLTAQESKHSLAEPWSCSKPPIGKIQPLPGPWAGTYIYNRRHQAANWPSEAETGKHQLHFSPLAYFIISYKQDYCTGQKSGWFPELSHNSVTWPVVPRRAQLQQSWALPLQSVTMSAHSRSLTRLCQNDPGWLSI